MKIYVSDLTKACYVVQNDTTIRGYDEMPRNNAEIEYTDYYFTANYLYRDGTQTFSNYTTLPVCLDSSVLTDSFYYRNDFDSILIIFLIMCIFCFMLPLKLFLRLFKRHK